MLVQESATSATRAALSRAWLSLVMLKLALKVRELEPELRALERLAPKIEARLTKWKGKS